MIKVTMEFNSPTEAVAFLTKSMGAPSGATVSWTPEGPRFAVDKGVYTAPFVVETTIDEKKPEVEPQKTVETAPVVAETTIDEVRNAFKAYVGKAGGRTAATGIAICKAHGVDNCSKENLGRLRGEQLRVLKRALDTAGPDMPFGEAA